jgi:hypothetical protein
MVLGVGVMEDGSATAVADSSAAARESSGDLMSSLLRTARFPFGGRKASQTVKARVGRMPNREVAPYRSNQYPFASWT